MPKPSAVGNASSSVLCALAVMLIMAAKAVRSLFIVSLYIISGVPWLGAPLISLIEIVLLAHKLAAILNDDALKAVINLLTSHVVANSISILSLYSADA